jgi:hypothetical protein
MIGIQLALNVGVIAPPSMIGMLAVESSTTGPIEIPRAPGNQGSSTSEFSGLPSAPAISCESVHPYCPHRFSSVVAVGLSSQRSKRDQRARLIPLRLASTSNVQSRSARKSERQRAI